MAAGAQYSSEVSVTSGSTAGVSGAVSFGFNAYSVYVTAASSGNDVYINFASSSGGASSTGDGICYHLPSASGRNSISVTPRKGYFTGLSYIAAATTTGYLKILAVR